MFGGIVSYKGIFVTERATGRSGGSSDGGVPRGRADRGVGIDESLGRVVIQSDGHVGLLQQRVDVHACPCAVAAGG